VPGLRRAEVAQLAGVSIEYVPSWSGRLARELGADYTVNALTQDPVQAIKELGGADAAIAVAVAPKAFEQAHRSLRRGGKLVLVALPADNAVQLPIFETVLNGITILRSNVGTRADLDEVFRLHAQGRTRVVRKVRQLDEVNECFEDVEKGPGAGSVMARMLPGSLSMTAKTR
jgi:propanol-preferring alcohol dehydrogenase